jgi:flagellar hook-length control protein FliK
MVNGTQLLEMNTETQTTRSRKNRSSVDAAEFANLLNAQNYQNAAPPTFDDIGGRSSDDAARSDRDLKSQADDKRAEDRSQRNEDDANDTKTHSRKDGDAEAGQDPTQSSDSGQEESAEDAMGVDGKDSGIQTGASTEADVNAQSFPSGVDSANAIQLDAQSAAADTADETFQDLIEQIVAQANPQQTDADGAEAMKISAKPIDRRTNALQTNLNLTDQKIMFETGLAEHFVRLLTDQFESMQNSTSTKTADAGTSIETPTAGLNAAGQQTSKSGMDLLFQTNSGAQSPDTQATENLNKIVNVIRSNIGHRQSQLTVRLDPPELGQIRVDIKLVDNNLQLAITTETNEARQMLTSRMETLRQTLEQSGIRMAKFEVVTQADQNQANQNQNWQQNQQNSNPNGFQFNQQQQQERQQAENQTGTPAPDETETPITFTETKGSNRNVNLVA